MGHDLVYNSRSFMICGVFPLAMAVGYFVRLTRGSHGAPKFYEGVLCVGGIVISGSYLLRYLPLFKGRFRRFPSVVVRFGRLIWISWMVALGVLWVLR